MRVAQEYPPLRKISVKGRNKFGVSTNTPRTRTKSRAHLPIVKGVPPPRSYYNNPLAILDRMALTS